MPDSYDIFISYAEADAAWVEGYLIDALEQTGVRYYSEAAFRLGVPLVVEFERAIKLSKRTLLIVSPAYLADGFGQFTDTLVAFYGLEMDTWPVIPLIFSPVELPLRLGRLKKLDATDSEQWPKVIESLCEDLKLPVPSVSSIPNCPYPGMIPFQEEDCDRFFGRNSEIADLLDRLRLHRFVTVIGPSGSGKSSLVLAGLLPELRQSRLFGTGEWCILKMRPGTNPLTSLSILLENDLVNINSVIEQLLKSHSAQRLLLVIDQFEEVFTQAEFEAIAFQNTLLALSQVNEVYLVITVRADFYADLMLSPLWEKIKKPNYRFEVTPLDETGLREAILKPADQAGVFIDSALLERLAIKATGEPGVLPLLQEVLVLLWEKVERRYLPLKAYEALVLPRQAFNNLGGYKLTGLQAAIARRADAAIDELTDDQQIIARRIFLRLIQFGEGRADTRRQQPVKDLKSQGEDDQQFEEALQHLVKFRLLTLSGDAQTTRKLDIAHEALINGWPQLQNWIAQRREAEQTRRRLMEKAEDWIRLGQKNGGLLDKVELEEAQRWLNTVAVQELGIDTKLLDFIEASRIAIQAEEARQEEAQQRELTLIRERLEQEKIANQHQQKAHHIAQTRNRIVTGSLGLLVGLSTLAVNRIIDSQIQTINALSNSAKSLFASHQQLEGLTEAIKAGKMVKESLFVPIETKIRVATALQQTIYNIQEKNRLTAHTGSVFSISLSPNNEMIASGSQDQKVILWSWDGKKQITLPRHDDLVATVRFSPDGRLIASSSYDKTVKLWSKDGKLIHTLTFDEPVCDANFSPDGKVFAVMNTNGDIKIWDFDHNNIKESLNKKYKVFKGLEEKLINISFSLDSKTFILPAEANNLKILNLKGDRLVTLKGNKTSVSTVNFNFKKSIIASGSQDGRINVWKTDGTLQESWQAHTPQSVRWVAFSPDGIKLVSSSNDGTIKVWQTDGTLLQTLQGHNSPVAEVQFSSDSKTLVSGGEDGTIRFWDLNEKPSNIIVKHNDWVNQVSFSPDGQSVASASSDGLIQLWNIQENSIKKIPGHEGSVVRVSFTPNGKTLASASKDKTIRIWNLEEPSSPVIIKGTGDDFWDFSLSADGKKIAAPSAGGVINLWTIDGRSLPPIKTDNQVLWDVTFSPDSQMVASGGRSQEIKLWSLEGKLIQSFLGHLDTIVQVSFSPNNQSIISGSDDGNVKLWTIKGKEILNIPASNARVRAVRFSPKYEFIASASEDQTIKLWNKNGLLIDVLKGQAPILDISFSPDGQKILAADGTTVKLWNFDIDMLLLEGCSWMSNYSNNSSMQGGDKLCDNFNN